MQDVESPCAKSGRPARGILGSPEYDGPAPCRRDYRGIKFVSLWAAGRIGAADAEGQLSAM